jgi:hypothetical protein
MCNIVYRQNKLQYEIQPRRSFYNSGHYTYIMGGRFVYDGLAHSRHGAADNRWRPFRIKPLPAAEIGLLHIVR